MPSGRQTTLPAKRSPPTWLACQTQPAGARVGAAPRTPPARSGRSSGRACRGCRRAAAGGARLADGGRLAEQSAARSSSSRWDAARASSLAEARAALGRRAVRRRRIRSLAARAAGRLTSRSRERGSARSCAARWSRRRPAKTVPRRADRDGQWPAYSTSSQCSTRLAVAASRLAARARRPRRRTAARRRAHATRAASAVGEQPLERRVDAERALELAVLARRAGRVSAAGRVLAPRG